MQHGLGQRMDKHTNQMTEGSGTCPTITCLAGFEKGQRQYSSESSLFHRFLRQLDKVVGMKNDTGMSGVTSATSCMISVISYHLMHQLHCEVFNAGEMKTFIHKGSVHKCL